MNISFKYRIYPTVGQMVLLNKHIGAARFIYNLGLETNIMAWAGSKTRLSKHDLNKQLPNLKTSCEWLREVNSQSLQSSLMYLDAAFTAFFKGQCKFPKFKKKTSGGSFNIPQNVTLIDDCKLLSIPKFKKGIKINLHRPIKGTIKQATISRTPTGKYFVSILCDTGEKPKPKKPITENTTIGIDLGIKTFLVTSDGTEYDNPKFLRKAQSKLKYIQRKFSKYKGKRTKHKLALLHEKVTNQRKDFLNKTSTELIKNHDSLAIEDLNVSGMLKTHCLAQSISDVGWGMFIDMLEYKALWNGNNILRIGRFDPSSKLCSHCGTINKELTLQDREWTCGNCNETHNRDKNAAINIKNFSLKNHIPSVERRLKNQNELPTLVGVLTSEALSL